MSVTFGRFVLDPAEFRLTRDGEVVPLSPKPFDLLAALVARPGQLLSRDELLRTVWKDAVVEQSSLNAAMSILRRALGDDSASLIETVPGRGYRFLGRAVGTESGEPPAAPPAGADLPRIVIIDDHAVVRLGVRTLLSQRHSAQLVGEAGSVADAAELIAASQPDLAILDLMIDGESSLPHIAAWRNLAPHLRVIVLSMHDEGEWARRALVAGARGYVMKSEMLGELTAAIDAVAAGGVWVSARAGRGIVQDLFDSGALPQ